MNLELWIKQIRKTFPWYAQLLRENQAEANQLESLPLMTEELLTQHYYHAEHTFPDRYHNYQTSGTTTGKRKRIIYSDNDQHIYLQQRMGIIKNFCSEGYIPMPVLIWAPAMRLLQQVKFFSPWDVKWN
ncbi:hypothetical protein [Xenorhabdus sp. TS4]|uniref:hypothetical protein n=1 Tax=Xenorhabdus sp. TS4 TaxID=1873483 RepID=UPI002101EE27|nr:hypothetical protein [Xenorhabdus sp. TS4]MBC8951266.1 Fumarate---2,3-diaminopropanoate ligase [Xenorhabdus sp. TS4]